MNPIRVTKWTLWDNNVWSGPACPSPNRQVVSVEDYKILQQMILKLQKEVEELKRANNPFPCDLRTPKKD